MTHIEKVPHLAISDEERRRRREAVSYATASVRLEGFVMSEEQERHAERFINGEIDLAEFVKVPHDPIIPR
ncbi:antitoxin VbhA family protein [Xanthobacter sediminis]|uniref:antitoxin VbhA family protein n=1 Tax=Xanthobacter sediminis TaxID=3119926 RepID=UPI0037291F29